MTAALPPRPVRRALLDPLWIPLALLLAVVLSVLALLSWCAWRLLIPLRRTRGRVWRLAGLAVLYLALDVAMVLGCFGLWLRRPTRRLQRWPGWLPAHVRLLRWCLSRVMVASRALVGFQVVLAAPPPMLASSVAPVLVLARHAGPGDSFTLVHLIAGQLDRCPRVVLKAALQWDPGLDVLLNRLRCCFLPSRSGAGEDRTAQLTELAAGLGANDALLLFPEGGNWTPKRHRRAVQRLRLAGRRRAARAAEANSPVLPPRPGGTVACLRQRPDADILVVAHSGLDTLVSPAQLWRALPLTQRPMTIDWWQQPGHSVPADDAGRLRWLQEQWNRIDDWVAEHVSASPGSADDAGSPQLCPPLG